MTVLSKVVEAMGIITIFYWMFLGLGMVLANSGNEGSSQSTRKKLIVSEIVVILSVGVFLFLGIRYYIPIWMHVVTTILGLRWACMAQRHLNEYKKLYPDNH